MTGQMLIRPVVREDFDQWLPLWEGYNAFYGRAGPTALPEAVTAVAWERFFAADEPVGALVAKLDGALVGLAHYLFHRSMILVEPVCYMQDLFTSEAARGRGVGRALIEAVYAQAQAAGAASVYWHTHNGNATARRLYDQVADDTGFVVYRRRLPAGDAA